MTHPNEASNSSSTDDLLKPDSFDLYPPFSTLPPATPSAASLRNINSEKIQRSRRSRQQRQAGGNVGDLDLVARASRSLLANVLDLDDDIRGVSYAPQPPAYNACVTGTPPPERGGHQGIMMGIGHPPSSHPASPRLQRSYQPPLGHSDSFYTETALQAAASGASSSGAAAPAAELGQGGLGAGLGTQGVGVFGCSTRAELVAILRELRCITAKIKNDEEDAATAAEWKFAARVIDRFCLVIFSLFTVISTCAILFSAPNIFKT